MFGRRRIALVLLSSMLAYAGYRVRLPDLLFERGAVPTRSEWRRIATSPGGDQRYPPQGLTVVDDELVVTNHWNGRKSGIYRVDPVTGEVEGSATMPPEAKHTSGLAWDGERLWAVDHASNRLYRLHLAATFAEGRAVVEETFETGLRGASGLTLLDVDGREYIAVSDFLWTIETTPTLPIGSGKTYLAPREDVEAGSGVREAATVAYRNGGYSQGLTWDGAYLYESLNNLGTDRVEVLDVARTLRDAKTDAVERRGSFEGPASRIEDLGTDGERLWTTDEGSYGLYRFDALDEMRRRFAGE